MGKNKVVFVFIIMVLFFIQVCCTLQPNCSLNKVTGSMFGLNENSIKKGCSIYMWHVNDIDYNTYDNIVKYLNINKIYAYIGTAHIQNKVNTDYVQQLFSFAESKNIETYIVYDENYSNQVENSNRIKELIEEVKDYNLTAEHKIPGIAIDSEFYVMDDYRSLSDEGKIQRFKDYVYAMKEAYNLAKQYNIKYVVCIPVWLDKLDIGELEELIKNGCDYVQMMNYTKSGMIKNISDEISFAKKYNKPIENIAEFQEPGPHEVTDTITFYNDGIDAGIQKFEEIDSTYNYDLLTFSFHSLKPLLELIKDVEVVDNTGNNNENNNNTNENSNNQNETNNDNTNTNENNNNQDEANSNTNTNNNTSQSDNNSIINIYTNQDNNTDSTTENTNSNSSSNNVNNNSSKTNTTTTKNTTKSNTDKTVAQGTLPQTGIEDNYIIVLAIGIMLIIVGTSLIKIIK